jgi:hypothetical protein
MRGIRSLRFAFFVLLGFVGPATAGDLTGRWIIRWENNTKNENAASLTLHGDRLSGTYINDSKASCSVTGNVRDQIFSLTIVCPQWDIRMQGHQTADGRNASGKYQAYIDTKGVFTMRKM